MSIGRLLHHNTGRLRQGFWKITRLFMGKLIGLLHINAMGGIFGVHGASRRRDRNRFEQRNRDLKVDVSLGGKCWACARS